MDRGNCTYEFQRGGNKMMRNSASYGWLTRRCTRRRPRRSRAAAGAGERQRYTAEAPRNKLIVIRYPYLWGNTWFEIKCS